MRPMMPILCAFFLALLAAGCNRSNDAAVTQAKVEAEAAKAEAQAAKAELGKAQARVTAAEGELAKLKSAQVQPNLTDADRRAAEWVLRVGGMVRVFADGVLNEYPKDGKLPDGPFQVILVDLNRPAEAGKLTNEGMKFLAGLKHVKELHMNNTLNVTDFSFFKGMDSLEVFHGALTGEGLTYLKAIPGIKDLLVGFFWGNPKITDAELVGFKTFQNLEVLDLIGCDVTNRGLAELRDLKKLRILSLFKTKVTDDGLQHLTGLAELRELSLAATVVNGSGLEQLKGLPKLVKVGLGDTKITDAGLANLRSLPKLEVVTANINAGISDAGLVHLKGMSNLKHLDLRDTKVTDAGVADLTKSLPNCQIVVK